MLAYLQLTTHFRNLRTQIQMGTAGQDERNESLCRPRLNAATYHEMMELDAQPVDRFAPNFRPPKLPTVSNV